MAAKGARAAGGPPGTGQEGPPTDQAVAGTSSR